MSHLASIIRSNVQEHLRSSVKEAIELAFQDRPRSRSRSRGADSLQDFINDQVQQVIEESIETTLCDTLRSVLKQEIIALFVKPTKSSFLPQDIIRPKEVSSLSRRSPISPSITLKFDGSEISEHIITTPVAFDSKKGIWAEIDDSEISLMDNNSPKSRRDSLRRIRKIGIDTSAFQSEFEGSIPTTPVNEKGEEIEENKSDISNGVHKKPSSLRSKVLNKKLVTRLSGDALPTDCPTPTSRKRSELSASNSFEFDVPETEKEEKPKPTLQVRSDKRLIVQSSDPCPSPTSSRGKKMLFMKSEIESKRISASVDSITVTKNPVIDRFRKSLSAGVLSTSDSSHKMEECATPSSKEIATKSFEFPALQEDAL